MPHELLEPMALLDDVNLIVQGNYLFPLLDLRVTSNCHRVFRYLDFFLEPFRSKPSEFSEAFGLTLLVDEPPLASRTKRILHKCDDPRSARVCYSPTHARVLYEDGTLYFKANDQVFGILSAEERKGLLIFNKESIFIHQPPFFGIFVFILTEILASINCVLLHAASLVGPNGGFCIVGASGAGKTTLLMSLLRTGRYQFLGDEWCMAQRSRKSWNIWALTPKVRVPRSSLQYLLELGRCTNGSIPPLKEKIYLDPRKIYGNCFRAVCTPTFILFLENGAGLPSTMESIQPFEALNRMMENMFVPLAQESFLRNINTVNDLIHQLKNFRLLRSTVFEESVSLVDSVGAYL